jgi:hypothetical protein
MKIDMVYLWVDGSDEQWLAKRDGELKKAGKLPLEAIGTCRFTDNDELLFSLRSIEKHASWINRVFIVTDSQIPKWLNTDNSKITVVDLTEIMPKEVLPCFNSNVIEFFIPYIPNLSEHFIYANDDMLFMAKTNPTYFFAKKGIPIIRVNNNRKVKRWIKNILPVCDKYKENWKYGTLYDRAKLNSRKLAYEITGINYQWDDAHNIDPYRKSDMLAVINMPSVKQKISDMKFCRFRDDKCLHRILFHFLGVTKYRYKTIGRDNLTRLFQYLMLQFREQPLYAVNVNRDTRWRLRKKLTCVEDPTDTKIRESNHTYLTKMFPNKSKYEK